MPEHAAPEAGHRVTPAPCPAQGIVPPEQHHQGRADTQPEEGLGGLVLSSAHVSERLAQRGERRRRQGRGDRQLASPGSVTAERLGQVPAHAGEAGVGGFRGSILGPVRRHRRWGRRNRSPRQAAQVPGRGVRHEEASMI